MILFAWVLSSCAVEEDLEPSLVDIDRVGGKIDSNNALIAKWYDVFNTGVLYEYDSILDFAFVGGTNTAADKWEVMEIPTIGSLYAVDTLVDTLYVWPEVEYDVYVQESLDFMDTAIFKFFDPNGAIAGLMPTKVLLSESVYANSAIQGYYGATLTESDDRYSRYDQYDLRAVFNDHSLVLSMHRDDVMNDPEGSARDMFYIFLCRIMGIHELYKELPESFFAGKSDLYGADIDVPFAEYLGVTDEVEAGVFDMGYLYVDKDWFYSLGFIDADYFYSSGSTASSLGNRTQYYDGYGNRFDIADRPYFERAIYTTWTFIGDEFEDARSYLKQLMILDEATFLAYPQNIQENLQAVYDLWTNLGVDLDGVNPELETIFATL